MLFFMVGPDRQGDYRVLRLAEADWDAAEEDTASAVTTTDAVVRVAAAPAAGHRPAGRYGASRRINTPAVIITVLFHALLLGALLHIHQERVERKERRLTTVNLQPPPAPPPPPETRPQPPAKAAIAAPAPRIEVPRPAPLVATAPEPTPVAVSVPAVAPPAPPVPLAVPSVMKAKDLGTRMISAVPPRYPTESRRQREQGTVVLELTLDADGRVAHIAVARSSGFSRLDEAALRAVRKWRWAPTMRDGQAVMVQGLVEIPFVLKG
jgi:protein TonB